MQPIPLERSTVVNSVHKLRLTGIVEGISYLLLLFVAMPLKYGFDMPLAVRLVGSLHGLLFLWFCAALLRTVLERRWRPATWMPVFFAALVPLGFLLIERKLQSEIRNAARVADGD
jgi:integral membrane protein